MLVSFNLKLALYQPARLMSKTCIDNFAHNFNRRCQSLVLKWALSDHTAQLLNCPITTICTFSRWSRRRRDYISDIINKFKTYLRSLSFSEVYEANDLNVALIRFQISSHYYANSASPKLWFRLMSIKNKTGYHAELKDAVWKIT